MNKNRIPDVSLNLNIRGLPQSATLAINQKSNELLKQGKMVYKLGLGQSPFPVPQPVVDELKVNAHQKEYLPVKGLQHLREAVATYYCKNHGVCATADDVLIGPGSKELMFLLQYVYYGDLLIPIPSWVSYAPQAQIIGRQVRWLQTSKKNNWRLTAEELKVQCTNDPYKPRIVILNYPSNPVGVTYAIEDLKKIAKVARDHKLILLSDEIYGELNHKGKHVSIAQYYPEGTIISGGLSKWCGAGGWRLGTFIFPKPLRWLLDAIAVMASETFTSTSTPIQYSAVRAFERGNEIEQYLWRQRWILEKLGNRISKKLNKKGIYNPKPQGAFYLFVDFSNFKENLLQRNVVTSTQLCNSLLEDTGVAVLPGHDFGMPSTDLTARLAYVDFDGAKAINSALNLHSIDNIDDEFLDLYCGKITKAIDLIIDWTNS